MDSTASFVAMANIAAELRLGVEQLQSQLESATQRIAVLEAKTNTEEDS